MGRATLGGVLNPFGTMNAGSCRGQHSGRVQWAAFLASSFSPVCIEFLWPTHIICRRAFSIFAGSASKPKALEDSSLSACSPAVQTAVENGSRSKSSSEKA